MFLEEQSQVPLDRPLGWSIHSFEGKTSPCPSQDLQKREGSLLCLPGHTWGLTAQKGAYSCGVGAPSALHALCSLLVL